MDFTVDIKGIFIENTAQIDEIESEILSKCANRINDGSDMLVKDIRNVLKKVQSKGRRYRRPFGRIHIASLPEFPPNLDTGRLHDGTRFKPAKKTSRSIIDSEIYSDPTVAGAKTNYAFYLQQGTVKMGARPFFYETIEKRAKMVKFKKIIIQIRSVVENVMRAKALRPGRRRRI